MDLLLEIELSIMTQILEKRTYKMIKDLEEIELNSSRPKKETKARMIKAKEDLTNKREAYATEIRKSDNRIIAIIEEQDIEERKEAKDFLMVNLENTQQRISEVEISLEAIADKYNYRPKRERGTNFFVKPSFLPQEYFALEDELFQLRIGEINYQKYIAYLKTRSTGKVTGSEGFHM